MVCRILHTSPATSQQTLNPAPSIPSPHPLQIMALALRWGGKFVEAFLKMLPFWRHLLQNGHQPEFHLLVRLKCVQGSGPFTSGTKEGTGPVQEPDLI